MRGVGILGIVGHFYQAFHVAKDLDIFIGEKGVSLPVGSVHVDSMGRKWIKADQPRLWMNEAAFAQYQQSFL
jgi:hypothetical protein